MGHKGVSKRKVKQEKTKPLSDESANGTVASAVKASKSQPVTPLTAGKPFPLGKSGGKSSADRKKNPSKG